MLTGHTAANTSYLISKFLYYITFDCTGFLTCLISLTRTVKVCNPFFPMKGVWAAVSFLLFFLYSLTRESALYFLVFQKPVENVEKIVKYYPALYALVTLFNMITVVLSSIVTAYWLLYKTRYKRKISKNNRHATITVLILSAVFFMMNTIFVSAAIISFGFGIKVIKFSKSLHAFIEIVFSLSQCLNSTANPMIYLTRKKEMRKFVVGTWRTVKYKLSITKVEQVLET
jgi:hypothetical protein